MAEGEKKFMQVGHLKEGNYVLIDGFVCQVKSSEKSKPGKHGAAKARITAIGVFDDSKRQLLKGTGDDNEVPIIIRGNAQIVAIMGSTLADGPFNVRNPRSSNAKRRFRITAGRRNRIHQMGRQLQGNEKNQRKQIRMKPKKTFAINRLPALAKRHKQYAKASWMLGGKQGRYWREFISAFFKSQPGLGRIMIRSYPTTEKNFKQIIPRMRHWLIRQKKQKTTKKQTR